MHVWVSGEAGGQVSGVGYLLPSCGSLRLNLGLEDWWQASLLKTPSLAPSLGIAGIAPLLSTLPPPPHPHHRNTKKSQTSS